MLTYLRLRNFKIYGDPGVTARFAPVTILLGANSAGKSTLLQALQVLRQTWGAGDFWRLMVEGEHARLGNFANVIHGHDLEREMEIEVGFEDQGGKERSVCVRARAHADRGSQITAYWVRPRVGDCPANRPEGVVLTEGRPPIGAAAGGVWFDVDAASLAAWYDDPAVADDLEWWSVHEGRLSVLVRLTDREIDVYVEAKPAEFDQLEWENSDPERNRRPLPPLSPPRFGMREWGRACVPRPDVIGPFADEAARLAAEEVADTEWMGEVVRLWPEEWAAIAAEGMDERAANSRWMARAPPPDPATWPAEWLVRVVQRQAHELEARAHADAVLDWEARLQDALDEWQMGEDMFIEEFGDWRARACEAGSPLRAVILRPVDDVIRGAVAQVQELSFIGGLRLPSERWTEVAGPAPASVGSDGRDTVALLAAGGAAATSKLNRALKAVKTGYELRLVRSDELRLPGPDVDGNRLPAAAYVTLHQDKPIAASVGLHDVGSGIRQLLPVLAQYEHLVDRSLGVGLTPTLFIEQPELHLHPRLQGDLMSWLSGLEAVNEDAHPPPVDAAVPAWKQRIGVPQVVIETHGEVMVRRVGRMISGAWGDRGGERYSILVVHDSSSGRAIGEVGVYPNGELKWNSESLRFGFFDDRYAELAD